MFQTEKDVSDVRARAKELPEGDFKKTVLALLDIVAHERRGDSKLAEIALIKCGLATAYIDRKNSTGEILVYVNCDDQVTAESLERQLYVRDSPDAPHPALFSFALLVKHPARAMANAG